MRPCELCQDSWATEPESQHISACAQLASRRGWVIVLDNVDDPTFLKGYPDVDAATPTTKRQLISYIPYCQHESILITSRNKGAALQLVEHEDIIAIEPMNKEHALRLSAAKHCLHTSRVSNKSSFFSRSPRSSTLNTTINAAILVSSGLQRRSCGLFPYNRYTTYSFILE